MVVAAAHIAEHYRPRALEEGVDGGGGEVPAGVEPHDAQPLTLAPHLCLHQLTNVTTSLHILGKCHQAAAIVACCLLFPLRRRRSQHSAMKHNDYG